MTKIEEETLQKLKNADGRTMRWVETGLRDTMALNRLYKKGLVERYPDPLTGIPQNYSWRIPDEF